MDKPGRQFPGVGVCCMIWRLRGGEGKAVLECLLLKRQGSHGPNTWAPPGGWIDHGEHWYQAAEREALEEVNLVVSAHGLDDVTNDIFPESGIHGITMFIRCDMVPSNQEPKLMEPDKASDLGWFTRPECSAMRNELFLPLRTYMSGWFH